jgi:hypothetical protein
MERRPIERGQIFSGWSSRTASSRAPTRAAKLGPTRSEYRCIGT